MHQVRSCLPEECDQVLALWREAETRPTPTDELDELQRLARDNSDLFLIAEEEGRLIGTLIAGWDGWRAHLYRVAVKPEHQRKGVGKSLVLEAMKRLKQKGARRLSVLVVTEDAHSIGFWDSLADNGLAPDPWPKTRYIKTL